MAWLSWPLIHWCGPEPAAGSTEGTFVPSLHELIATRLQASAPGLYALAPVDASHDEVRLEQVTGPRLATTAHTLALAKPGRSCGGQGKTTRERIHLIGEALRESNDRSATPVLLPRLAWRVTATEVTPPLSLCRLHRQRGVSLSPDVGRCLMDYALRSGAPRLEPFIEVLDVLMAESRLVDGEHQRRQGHLCSLLRKTMIFEAPYFPVVFRGPNGFTITKWKPSADFARAAVTRFLRDLPPAAKRALPNEVRKKLTFEQICERVAGTRFTVFSKGPLEKSPPDLLARLRRAMDSARTEAESPAEFLKLVARYAALTGDPRTVRPLVKWLRVCRQLGFISRADGGTWTRAAAALQAWMTAANGDAHNLMRLSELLASRSAELFSFGWIRQSKPPPALWTLGALGGVSRKEALTIVDLEQIESVHRHFSEKPEQLSLYLTFLAEHRDTDARERRDLCALFSGIHDTQLLAVLAQWIDRLHVERGINVHEALQLVPKVHAFVGEAGRERREKFLSSHRDLLERLLDEIDFIHRALPPEGLEEWRSYASLWKRRFGLFEIAYRWERAGFSNGTHLVNALLAWCRREDERAIRQQETHPWYHFCNARGSEALLVRLSAGDPLRLIGLLDYDPENWKQRDDPLDGWSFLHAYPAVQQTLQELCWRPARLRVTVRILRRLALALRLQQRPFLRRRLDEWMAAMDCVGAVESLQAFGRLAGFGDDLPRAIARVLSREESLQRELVTLRGMGDHLSASQCRRLTKLERLLSQPEAIAAWVEKDLRREVARLMPLAKGCALARITREAVRAHWGEVFCALSGSVDWDNALHFYYSAEQNKAVLRNLLRHVATQDQQWLLRHPPNAAFLDELRRKGLEAEAWLQPYEKIVPVHGERWSARLEQDPLRVLQMGNLFGTCLSVDDCNAFAAIANAVEINKQVLYLRDSNDTIIGRKLIGLTSDGRLFGFRSYGAVCLEDLDGFERPRVWIKILFDLACLELLRRVDGRFDRSEDPDNAADSLRLSADWYNDGPEPFDWWILDHGEAILADQREPVAQAVTERFRGCDPNAKAVQNDALPTLRALLWLDDDAAGVLESIDTGSLGAAGQRFLLHQTQSEAVRALLRPRLSMTG